MDRSMTRPVTRFSAVALLAMVGATATTRARAGDPPAGADGVRWPGESGRRIVVSVAITIIEFARIGAAEETFEMAGYLDLSWIDPTLVPRDGQARRDRRRFRKGDIWSPELEFVNAAEQVRSEREGDLYVGPDGRVTQRIRFSHNFRSPLGLKRFPFDHQTLSIVIAPFDPIARDVDLAVAPGAAGKLPRASVPDWRIGAASARVERAGEGDLSEPRFIFEVKVSRRSTFYLWRIFIPLALLTAASWSVFWIAEDAAPAKFGTAVTVLVSLVAFSYSIDFSLPKVPYLTYLDTFSLTVFAFVLSVIFAVTAIHTLHRSRGPEAADRLQSIARWAFPASFAALIAIEAVVSLA